MRVLSRFLILFFVLVLGLYGAQSARAVSIGEGWAYGGAWHPTDGDVNALRFTPVTCENLLKLYMYKWGEEKNTSSDLLVLDLIPSAPFQAATVAIGWSDTAGKWFAKRGSEELDLGSSNWFGLYYFAGGNFHDPVITGGGSNWVVQPPSLRASVALVDATPVPVPAAAWILGSGLLGIAGLRKRFKG